MSGKIITLGVHYIIRGGGYEWNTGKAIPLTLCDFPDNDENTYITIFGASQNTQLETFKRLFKGNILFESVKSVNGKGGHGVFPRNTVVIYEPVSKV